MIEDLCASLILYKKQENASMQINSENDLKFKIWSETFEKSDLRSRETFQKFDLRRCEIFEKFDLRCKTFEMSTILLSSSH
jgi:hypothetical protein